jgi:hypothetical protein
MYTDNIHLRVCRAMGYVIRAQDVYLQTNTLAALANLAPFATNLSSHASQRIVVLLDVFYRRYQRLLQPHHGPGMPHVNASQFAPWALVKSPL